MDAINADARVRLIRRQPPELLRVTRYAEKAPKGHTPPPRVDALPRRHGSTS